MFLTLTVRRGLHATAPEAAQALSHAWRKLRLRWMRLKKLKHLPFIAVFEAHKSGWPHLHILLRAGFIDFQWLKATMTELLDSPHVFVERITNRQQVSGYCAKYAGKGTSKFGTSKRYWKSADYEQRPRRERAIFDQRWRGHEVQDIIFDRLISDYRQLGWAVTMISHDKAHVALGP